MQTAAPSPRSPVPPNAALHPDITITRPGPRLQIFCPKRFEWNIVRLPIPNLPPALAGLRLLHLTDLHLRRRWCAEYDELFDRLRADPPAAVLISGDHVEHRFTYGRATETVRRFVTSLTSKLGTFSILGNHDGDLLGPALVSWGVNVINARIAQLPIADATLELIGIPGVNRKDIQGGFLATVPPRLPASARVILSHYPDSIRRLEALHPDVVLAGHTHGGQACLPNGTPIITHDSLPRSQSKGVHRIHDSWLVVGRGFGFAGLPFRLFCPAEVIEIVLVPAPAA